MKFRTRPQYVEAFQWFKMGDVPEVVAIPLKEKTRGRPASCGWLDTPQGGHLVFPGDWVVFNQKGEVTTINQISFAKRFEKVETKILPTPGQFAKTA